MANTTSRIDKASPKSVSSNGQAIHNQLLLSLPARECSTILKHVEFISLPTHTILNEADAPIKFAYFVNDGLASVLNVMANGKSVEVGLGGSEGFVGLPLMAGFSTSPTRIVMQVGGAAVSESAPNNSPWPFASALD